ncbi:hypothetical protein PAESOLCIP111_03460 [Paenibacillus solanacearum]|uniref:Uncharacterized protein n=1 Tax=Paenibacillus solanacearum TaxID=2048548 RepID=A0A916K2K4_9BACL|nr:hypothetical protein [Paenibacillus solanacearum]CAG7633247.1 hypothetical protein PAESOLCIP111_03460 [Paenibacillus solanacearum]
MSGFSAGRLFVWNEGWEKQTSGYTYEYFFESIAEYSERVNGQERAFEMDLCIPLKGAGGLCR